MTKKSETEKEAPKSVQNKYKATRDLSLGHFNIYARKGEVLILSDTQLQQLQPQIQSGTLKKV